MLHKLSSLRPHYSSLFLSLALIVCFADGARAQSPLDGFDPNANNTVQVVVVQPDGKILIGGDFTTVLGTTRNHIARLNSDGTLDTVFNPNANDTIFTIAVQSDGKILAGGQFNTIGGQTRNRIARLDAVTGLADSFDPNANNIVYSIAIQSDDKILIGGIFTSLAPNGGALVTRNRIARLNLDGTLDTAFDPNADFNVYSIAIQLAGKIVLGGGFTTIGGQTRNNIARLNPDGTLDTGFNPNANGIVYSIAIQSDGKILAGGQFTTVGGQTRNRIARLDATTGSADLFDPNSNGTVQSIVVQADGRILAGGFFAGIGGQTRNHIARLDASTGLADSFDPNVNFNNDVYSIAVQSDGKILAGGTFTSLSPNGGGTVTRNRIARLERDGRLDQTLDLGDMDGDVVHAIAIQPDGKILIGGRFTSIFGVTRNNIARLNTDGSLDTAFDPNAVGEVTAIVMQTDGKIIAGGFFTSMGGQSRSRIARLDASGAVDLSFNPDANNNVRTLAVQADGMILVGGQFFLIGGQPRSGIARLDATGAVDLSFNPNAGGDVLSITVQADGMILVGGEFNIIAGQTRRGIARLFATGVNAGMADSFNANSDGDVLGIAVQANGMILAGGRFINMGGQPRTYIARLDPVTGLADSFNPNADGFVYSITVQGDGRVIAGGTFNNIGGQPRNLIARLNGITGAADSFDPNANINAHGIAVLPDGKVLAGAQFTTIGGQPRDHFARLSNDTAALSTLSVTQTTLTLTRDGAAPQFNRLIFEQSTDNGANWTLLGTATSSFTSQTVYTLTGQSIPTGQNLLIRARGFYRSGYLNGSESITELVRNAFLIPELVINEIDYDQVGTDTAEFIELKNVSGGMINLDLFVVELINGLGCCTPYQSIDLPNVNLAAGDYYVICGDGATVLNCDLLLTPNTNIIQNGPPDAVGLRISGALVDAVSYEGDTDAPYTEGSGVGLIDDGTVDFQGISRFPDGVDTNVNNIDLSPRCITPGMTNTSASTGCAGVSPTPTDTPTPTNTATPTNTPTATDTPTSTPTGTPMGVINGTIRYGNAIGNPAPPRFVKNVSVASTSGTPAVGPVITGTPGTYTLTGFGEGSYTIKPTKPGGSNGAISSNDAARVAQGVSGAVAFVSQNQRFAADVSGNGGISSNDAALIARFAVGLTGTGNAGQWKFFVTGAPSPLPTAPQTYDDSRTYASVTSNLTGEDFVGILVGEVSGNWNPVTHPRAGRRVESRESRVESEDGGPVRGIDVILPQAIEVADKEIVVPVNVQGVADKEIISYEFDLRYDPAVIQPLEQPVDVTRTVSRGLLVVANPHEPGLLRVVVYGPMPIDENGVLLNLRFAAVGKSGSVSTLTFERIMFNEGESLVTTTDGKVELF